MYVVLAWFADHSLPVEWTAQARQRVQADLSPLVPDDYARHEFGGADWGLLVMHERDHGAWRWQTMASQGGVRAVSMGIPVGLDVAGGPIALAQDLLRGDDVHADVVPPFGLMAFEQDRRFVLQQDWLGMCRVFGGQSGGVTVFSSRPTLVARFLGETPKPDYDGWASYAVTGHFGGEFSPFHGVRQIQPGGRVSGQRRDGGGWDLTVATRFSVDDVVAAGIAARGRGIAAALDCAADGLAATAASVDKLYSDDIVVGLSGGKDSRLIAASLIASGRLPKFFTNEDLASEGEVARTLIAILRDQKGLAPEHRLQLVGSRAVVETMGLHERIRRLQYLYDYQFASSYSVRSPGPEHLPIAARPVSFSGAGGELATGYWYPDGADVASQSRLAGDKAIEGSLLIIGSSTSVTAPVLDKERARISLLVDRAENLGLQGLELVDYAYLVERVRRWYSSGFVVGMVTPYLSPSFVKASFAVSPLEKKGRIFHIGLIERLLPEWKDVPFATGSVQNSNAVRVWDGDGLQVIHKLLDTVHGDLTTLLRRDDIEAALARAVRGKGSTGTQKILQQFAYLAVASEALEPEGVRAPTVSFAEYKAATVNAASATPSDLLPKPLAKLVRRAGFVKKSRLGAALWSAVRTGVVRQRRR